MQPSSCIYHTTKFKMESIYRLQILINILKNLTKINISASKLLYHALAPKEMLLILVLFITVKLVAVMKLREADCKFCVVFQVDSLGRQAHRRLSWLSIGPLLCGRS